MVKRIERRNMASDRELICDECGETHEGRRAAWLLNDHLVVAHGLTPIEAFHRVGQEIHAEQMQRVFERRRAA